MKSGVFIVIEGIDGCGKTTQKDLLADFLTQKGYPVETTREPGGTLLGELIRELVLSPKYQEMLPLTETLLYLTDRAQHVGQKLLPALRTGRIVISERYIDSTIAYQGFGRGLDQAMLDRLNNLVTQGLKPNLTFLLDIPPEIARRRLISRKSNLPLDRLEQEKLAFYRRVREGYLALVQRQPDSYVVLDACQPPVIIHQKIQRLVEERILVSI
ncbi:MAG TPA: dTMP kinase [Desulfotomaculum sp.]|nr:dTMP kinase [Desulfotomaculum sp.]